MGCKVGGAGSYCSFFLGGRIGTGELRESLDVSKLELLVADRLEVWRTIGPVGGSRLCDASGMREVAVTGGGDLSSGKLPFI